MYFARVELHGAKWPSDYQQLHEKLELAKFYPYGVADSSGTMHLPSGTYASSMAYSSTQTAYKAVKVLADTVGFGNTVLVVDASSWICDLKSE